MNLISIIKSTAFAPDSQEERRLDHANPWEAKQNCETIERSLRSCEESVRTMFTDVHVMRERHHPQAENLNRRFVLGLCVLYSTKWGYDYNNQAAFHRMRLFGYLESSVSNPRIFVVVPWGTARFPPTTASIK